MLGLLAQQYIILSIEFKWVSQQVPVDDQEKFGPASLKR